MRSRVRWCTIWRMDDLTRRDDLTGVSPLPRSFLARPSPVVARELLGQIVGHRSDGVLRAARIVETEAYLDELDAASHARFGRTRRNASMFGTAGIAYVYLIYGVHTMLNVVTGAPGSAGAVLLRAAAPIAPPDALMNGPGKLARALGVRRDHDGVDMCAGLDASPLGLFYGSAPVAIAVGPRIGVAYAAAWRDAPLRFSDRDSRFVSRAPASVRAKTVPVS